MAGGGVGQDAVGWSGRGGDGVLRRRWRSRASVAATNVAGDCTEFDYTVDVVMVGYHAGQLRRATPRVTAGLASQAGAVDRDGDVGFGCVATRRRWRVLLWWLRRSRWRGLLVVRWQASMLIGLKGARKRTRLAVPAITVWLTAKHQTEN